MGGGLRALAHLDARFQVDTGVPDPGAFFQQSWVGLQHDGLGRITLGRQYNVLFDVAASTFAAFMPVGPFLNAYKPDVALALGVRNDNQVKLQFARNGLSVALQGSAGENAPFSTTTGKSWGGMARYKLGELAVGGGFLERRDAADRHAKALVLGTGYSSERVYANVAWARNTFDDGLNSALLLVGTGVENIVAPARPGQSVTHVRQRDMLSFGGMWRAAPPLWVGAQVWTVRQSFHTAGAPDGKGRFLALLADYSLSRRTDVYASMEHTSLTDLQLTDTTTGLPNGATSRTSVMLGMRHRF
jgi:predicted porin